MALPTYQDVMLPLLKAATDQEAKISDAIECLAQTYQLSEAERTQLLSGRQTIFANRVSWARTYLSKAGLLATPRRGFIRLTDEGRQLLATHPPRIDNNTLMQFASFRAFRTRDHDPVDNGVLQPPPILAHATPSPPMRSYGRRMTNWRQPWPQSCSSAFAWGHPLFLRN